MFTITGLRGGVISSKASSDRKSATWGGRGGGESCPGVQGLGFRA